MEGVAHKLKYHIQLHIDWFVFVFLSGGVFIETAAFDGETSSCTLYLFGKGERMERSSEW